MKCPRCNKEYNDNGIVTSCTCGWVFNNSSNIYEDDDDATELINQGDDSLSNNSEELTTILIGNVKPNNSTNISGESTEPQKSNSKMPIILGILGGIIIIALILVILFL